MFLDFYKMKLQPFGVTPDPRFLYLGRSHREALASVHYAIEANRGFVAMIAPPGLGKTTLAFQLLEKLQAASRTVFLFQTQCNSREMFQYLLNALGVDAEGRDLVSMHNKLNEILCREMLAGRRFVLAIDEAQNLDPAVLETVRLLSNFETSREKMLQILLIGQPQLAEKLAGPALEQLQQRISVFARIDPFDCEETSRYIAHRLQVAGYEGSTLFSPAALQKIAEESQGVPRKINSLCFGALSLGCAMAREQVDAAILEEVIADRDVQSMQRPKASPRVATHAPQPKDASAKVAAVAASPAKVVSHPAQRSQAMRRPTLSSYSATKPKRSFGLWAIGTAGIAACFVVGAGMLSLAPGLSDRPVHAASVAWAAVRDAAGSVRKVLDSKSDSVPISSTMNVQAAGLTGSDAGQAVAPSEDVATVAVVVQPGETLRQILLRTMGEYSTGTVAEVRMLNPEIGDIDHLEAGQSLRLPRGSGALETPGTIPESSAAAGMEEKIGAAGKNGNGSGRE